MKKKKKKIVKKRVPANVAVWYEYHGEVTDSQQHRIQSAAVSEDAPVQLLVPKRQELYLPRKEGRGGKKGEKTRHYVIVSNLERVS